MSSSSGEDIIPKESLSISQKRKVTLFRRIPPRASCQGVAGKTLIRKNPRRSSHKTSKKRKNQKESENQFTLMVDDDPPKRLPPGYKSPAELVKNGDEIMVYWEGDKKFYAGTARNLRTDGRRRIEYADGEVMYHLLSREIFFFSGKALDKFLASRYPEVERAVGGQPVAFPGLVDFVTIGCDVKVYWYSCRVYFPGRVMGKDARGRFHISFEDGEECLLRLEKETFRFDGLSAARIYSLLM